MPHSRINLKEHQALVLKELEKYNQNEEDLSPQKDSSLHKVLKPTIITTGYECECKEDLKNKMNFNLEMIPTKTEIKELSCVIYEMPQK